MACPEFEDLILDYCEGAASLADGAMLESHIAVCAACRAALAEQQELDLRLAKSLDRPALSPQFAEGLAARIAATPRRSRLGRLPHILNAMGYLGMAAAGGYVLQQLPHAGDWVGVVVLSACSAFGAWQTGKALHHNYVHRA